MITFPNAKINLGLSIGATLSNGYHEIVTAMIPVSWEDILEVVPSDSGEDTLHTSGLQVDCPPEKNLVFKALMAFRERFDVPAVDVFLRKQIPDGAGLGGGSADAAFMLRTLRDMFHSGVDDETLEEIAATLGSDVPMFIRNRPVLAVGTGTTLLPMDIDLPRLDNIVLVKPLRSVNTREAYRDVKPSYRTAEEILNLLRQPLEEWQGRLTNDFEHSVIPKVPEIGEILTDLRGQGAVYAAMSGSGSAVFGIFPSDIIADTTHFEERGFFVRKARMVQ